VPAASVTSLRAVRKSWAAPGHDLLDRAHDGQAVPGEHRPLVREALVAVHHAGEVEAELGSSRSTWRRAGHDDGERGRRDDVRMPRAAAAATSR
jgi:hypothetical protein